MKTSRLCLLFLLSTGALVAGDVSAAFRALAAGVRSVRIVAVPQEKKEKAAVVVYSDPVAVRRIVGAFDFVDPKPGHMPDGTVVYAGPCKCLPTHSFTFTLRDGPELVLFLDALDLAEIGVDVEKEDIQRLKMPWHTTLALTPVSAKSVASLLKSLRKKEANSEGRVTR